MQNQGLVKFKFVIGVGVTFLKNLKHEGHQVHKGRILDNFSPFSPS